MGGGREGRREWEGVGGSGRECVRVARIPSTSVHDEIITGRDLIRKRFIASVGKFMNSSVVTVNVEA